MATWRAKCWLGSANGYQDLEVQSNTFHGAKEQLERIYGAEQVINLREVRSGGGGSSDWGEIQGKFMLCLIGIAILIIIQFWWIVLPIGGILLILGMFMND